jgi:SAM-dependent methyltransferase
MGETGTMAAFVRRPRLEQSTPEFDALEVEWWNENAVLIERIWGLPDKLCRGARERYIREIRELFLHLGDSRPFKVLEVACGSGWPGRLLVSSTLTVTGIDFSEGQLQIAREKAREAGAINCNYVPMDINEIGGSFRTGQFDGAFIHCGIHHLSTAELTEFIELLARAPKGFPTILVEPVYLDKTSASGLFLGKVLGKIYSRFCRHYYARSSQDGNITKNADRLVKLATENGWFFSPKEVPFSGVEIRSLFSSFFEVKEIEPVTCFALESAQYLSTLKDQEAASRIAGRALPILDLFDRCLIRTKLLPKIASGYLFCRVVLVRK